MNIDLIQTLDEALRQGRRGVLCTIVGRHGSTPQRIGAKMWVTPDGSTCGTVGGGSLEAAAIRRSLEMLNSNEAHDLVQYHLDGADESSVDGGLICGGASSIYFELVGRRRQLIVFGAGHVGESLARLGSFCGYSVALWDDRPEFPTGKDLPPDIVVYHNSIAETLESLKAGQGCYVVCCTWGHQMDQDVLKAALDCPGVDYIGLMASKAKSATIKTRLKLTDQDWKRVFTPVGLSIGGASPQEIALSIMAQIVALDSGKLNHDSPDRRHA